MMMPKLHKVFILLSLIPIYFGNANAGTDLSKNDLIQYVGLESSRIITINQRENKFDNDHLIFSMEVCPSDSEYICMFGGLPFAIPRNIQDRKEWVINEHKFINHGKRSMSLLGRNFDLYRIELDKPEERVWYLYSHKYGLVSFGIYDEKGMDTFLLQGKKGFGVK